MRRPGGGPAFFQNPWGWNRSQHIPNTTRKALQIFRSIDLRQRHDPAAFRKTSGLVRPKNDAQSTIKTWVFCRKRLVLAIELVRAGDWLQSFFPLPPPWTQIASSISLAYLPVVWRQRASRVPCMHRRSLVVLAVFQSAISRSRPVSSSPDRQSRACLPCTAHGLKHTSSPINGGRNGQLCVGSRLVVESNPFSHRTPYPATRTPPIPRPSCPCCATA